MYTGVRTDLPAAANFAGALLAAVLLTAVLLTAATPQASAGPVLPDFSPDNFTPGTPIDNPYFPLVPGTVHTESATVADPESGDHGVEVDRDTVTGRTKVIGGVSARVVHSEVFLNGRQIEDTSDYYAQDKQGNVWYIGEDTTAFDLDDNGHVVGTDTSGTWRTGVHGAKPGFIMPAHPAVGMSYYQEFSPQDQATDQALIASLNEAVTVPFGHFTDVIKTVETTAAEPGVVENKFYARGVGEILVWEDLDSNGVPTNIIPVISVTTEPATSVPLPPAAWAELAAAVLLLAPRGLRAAGALLVKLGA
jgi:hypothetical protein